MCAMAGTPPPPPPPGQAGAGAQRVVAFVPDLMDRSKLESAARAHGLGLDLVARASELVGAVAGGASLVIVDLSRPGVLDAVRGLSGLAEQVRVLGFGSHVERDLLRCASEAGCAQVLARSAFFTRLPSLLGALR